jgi:NAD+ synthase (glutamine-hydrolysing)
MAKNLRIALAQFDFPVGDVAGNRQRIIDCITTARDEYDADIVVFPALSISGADPQGLLQHPVFLQACAQAVRDIAQVCTGVTAVVGWPKQIAGQMHRVASVLSDGVLLQESMRPLHAAKTVDATDCAMQSPCIFDVQGVTVGMLQAEDLRTSAPMACLAAAGATLVVAPAASHYVHDRHAQRDALLMQRSAETGVGIAQVNLVGGQDALVFDGASLVADGDGVVHPAAIAFEEQWLVVDYDSVARRFAPLQWTVDGDESRDALMWRALVRGTKDYCQKNGFSKIWLGLSGGIDSALVLAIAADALGAENVTAVRMPSRYTVDLSNDLAQIQCDTMGVNLLTLPIEQPFQAYLQTLEQAFSGKPADTTEENLQSRVRGTLLMALSNKQGGLLLTTGNKSEYAVGYATIYGDMNGGYAPLKDVYKTEVFALARWRNTVGDRVIPQAVIDRPPSAELRENQRDEDSLPPYDVLDAILRRYLDLHQSQAEIIAAGFDVAVVERVLRLVRIAEWKRQQAAPGPRLSAHAFGSGLRYPASNGWRE